MDATGTKTNLIAVIMIILFVFSAAGLMSSWMKTLKNYRMK